VSGSEKRRLFLAVNLSLATTRKVADAVAKLQRAAEARPELRAAWVPAANLHVTLKFLGWTRAEVVDPIRDKLRECVQGKKGFEVTARGAGGFPNAQHARVLWVGVQDPSGALGKLATELEARMETLGFSREARAFHPHVTIARVKEGRTEDLVSPFAQSDFGSSLIRDVILYESVMKSKGSEYTALCRVPLDAPPYRAERQTRGVETEGSMSTDEEPDTHGDGHESA
jgi:2'-5' RNA ligase